MALHLGGSSVAKAYVGTDAVEKVYLGATLVYAATPSITGNGDGTVDIVVDDGTFTITVSGSDTSHHNGTFGPFDTADLASGPIMVVAPVISGTAGTGETLTAAPGLWVFEADDAPTIAPEWFSDGTGTGDTDASYLTDAGDEGGDVDYRETATNSNGARTSTSNAISIPTSGTWNITDNGDGTFSIADAPPAPAALTATDNGDGTFNLEAA